MNMKKHRRWRAHTVRPYDELMNGQNAYYHLKIINKNNLLVAGEQSSAPTKYKKRKGVSL